MTLGDDLRVAAEEADARDASIVTLNKLHSDDLVKIATLEANVSNLTQKLADCEAQTPPDPGPGPDPTPTPPPTGVTDFGACATKGGSPSQVPVKWGKGAALRTFSATSGFTAPTAVPDAGTWHHSWKPDIGTAINNTTVAAACKPMRAGDHVELWHEADVKYNNQSLTAAQCAQIRDMKNQFFAAVKNVRPDLRVTTTYGAWIFDDKSGSYPGAADDPGKSTYWSSVKADVVGADCDGYSNLTKYPDFTSVIKNVKAYIAKYQYPGWAVPEFIHPRISSDPTGSQRAAFFTAQGTKFRDGKAVYVTLFDYEYRPGQTVQPGSPEFTAWKAFI